MKKALLLALAGMVSAASAVSLVDTDFTAPYIDGDLAGQQNWVAIPNTGIEAFSVNATAGVADTEPFSGSFNPTNGNYVYLNSSLGNLADDEWTGSMDFSLSTTAFAGTNTAVFSGAQEIFQIGLTDAVTNGLGSSDVVMQLRQKNTTMEVTLSKSGRYRTLGHLTNEEIGWDPTNPTNTDFQTDNLNLTWTIRKTRTADIYSASVVISNKLTGTVSVFDPDLFGSVPNLNYDTFSNVYNSASVNLAMGHHPDADEAGTNSLINIAVDSLVVDQTSGNLPELTAPILSASGSDSVVDLSWLVSIEATSYDVQRATASGGPYSFLANVATNAYSDTAVVNGTLYYYFVTAKAADAADVDSNEVVGEPLSAQTGPIFDTTFIDSEGYADSDLAGQDRWKAQQTTGANAFTVTDAAGEGFADNTVAAFDATLGNGVYYNSLMSNNVSDEWTGSFTFSLSTAPTAGQTISQTNALYDGTGTNVIGQATNSYDITGMMFAEILHFGLAAPESQDNEINNKTTGSGSVGINVRTTGSDGDLAFRLNNGDTLVSLKLEEMGWDPDWTLATTNGPDFVTDEITLNWRLRKSSDGAYRALADALVVNSAGETNSYASEGWGSTAGAAAGVYLSDLATFGMTHKKDANKGKDTNDVAYVISPVLVSVDAMSLEKADNVPPETEVPSNFRSDVADGTVFLDWDAAAEASSYIVRRYPDISGGSPVIVLANTTDLTYTDTGLVNGTTYFYSVAADYGVYGEKETAIIAVRPLGKSTITSWGYGDMVGGNLKFSMTDNTVGTTKNSIGAATGGGFYDASQVNSSLAPVLYGFMQLDYTGGTEAYAQRQIKDVGAADRYKLNVKNGIIGCSLGYIKQADFAGGNALNLTGTRVYAMEAQAFKVTNITGSGVHFAIRNGTQWYASETLFPETAATVVVADIAAEKWTPFTEATLSSSDLVTVVGASYAVISGLNNVNGFGVFVDKADLVEVEGFKITEGEQASSLQLWTDSYGIYNEDAAGTTDYDLDGVNNVHEWGTMGDPTDPGNSGKPTRSLGLDGTGTNLVYVYPRLESTPRPNYTVQETDNLVYLSVYPWEPANVTETGAGLWNTNNPSLGLEAVTNLVPVDIDVKFIGLEITE